MSFAAEAGTAGAIMRALGRALQAGGRAMAGLAALVLLASVVTVAAPRPAEAVVYCKTVGVPKGCVARPVAPAARAVIYCTRPGYPVGCVGAAPAARAAVYCTRPGYPVGCVAGGPVAAPAARAAVHCTRPGYPVGCVGGAGAPGPGVAPANLGGPVNRIGVR